MAIYSGKQIREVFEDVDDTYYVNALLYDMEDVVTKVEEGGCVLLPESMWIFGLFVGQKGAFERGGGAVGDALFSPRDITAS